MYRLAHYEMYTAESLSNVFLYLIDDVFGENRLNCEVTGIVYDRSCDLFPFIQKLSKNGNDIASRYLKLHYMVDIFHVENHTMTKCVLKHPDCMFHQHLEKFSFVNGMNTEIAKQSFSKLNPFKNSTSKMAYGKIMLYLKFEDDHENTRLFN